MAGHRDKLAGLDCQIAEAVAEREDADGLSRRGEGGRRHRHGKTKNELEERV